MLLIFYFLMKGIDQKKKKKKQPRNTHLRFKDTKSTSLTKQSRE